MEGASEFLTEYAFHSAGLGGMPFLVLNLSLDVVDGNTERTNAIRFNVIS